MHSLIACLRRAWSRSRAYRTVLIITLLYVLLRLAVHGAYLAIMLAPEHRGAGPLPGWAEADGPMLPVDLQVYLDAADRFQLRDNLYLSGRVTRLEDLYQYSPSFAVAFTPFLALPPTAVAVLHTLFHLAAYALLYVSWYRIFRRLGLIRAEEMLIWTLPVWLLFPDFWSDLGYLNIYVAMALLCTLLIEAILEQRLGRSLLWLSLILQTKPQWAVVAAVPLFLGRRRFFFQLIGLAVAAHASVMSLTVIISGPAYAIGQYVDYARLLSRLSRVFPWRSPESSFLGYNHSIKQVVVYMLGPRLGTFRLAAGIKAFLLGPLAVVGFRHVWRPLERGGYELSRLSLDAAFALYLGAFIWLDMVWEVSLGIAVFTYLLGTVRTLASRLLTIAVFAPYAVVDVLRLSGAILSFLGLPTIVPGPYVLTDISVHVPLVMLVILAFYAILIRRLWIAASPGRPTGARQWTLTVS